MTAGGVLQRWARWCTTYNSQWVAKFDNDAFRRRISDLWNIHNSGILIVLVDTWLSKKSLNGQKIGLDWSQKSLKQSKLIGRILYINDFMDCKASELQSLTLSRFVREFRTLEKITTFVL